MHDDSADRYDHARERRSTVEECEKCHASVPDRPGTPSITRVGPAGDVTVFHPEECMDDLMREFDAQLDEGKRKEAKVRRGLAALCAHLRDRPPAADDAAAPYAAVLAELVDRYLVQDMRGRYLIHKDVFAIIGRHLAHVPGIDGHPTPRPDRRITTDLEAFTVPEDDAALLAWVLDHGGTIPYDGELQYRPDPLHRIVLADGESLVVAPGDRLPDGPGTIHLAIPDHAGDH